MKGILSIFLLLASSLAFAEKLSLQEFKHTDVASLLDNIRVLAEIAELSKSHSPIKVFSLQEDGECGVKPDTCPKSELIVLISSFSEYPERKIYVTPKSYGWKFSRWILLPKSNEESAVFEIIETIISENRTKGWWKQRKRRVHVNVTEGYIE